MGWTGCLVAAFYLIHRHNGNENGAAPPSKGFPGYIYPNQEICDMYQGVPCESGAIPFAIISTLIGAYYKSNKAAGATGYLLIVAFDVVFATVIAPLFGAFYTRKPSPRAAVCSVVVGAVTRIVLEFALLPKDGFLLLPYSGPEFDNYGAARLSSFRSLWTHQQKSNGIQSPVTR